MSTVRKIYLVEKGSTRAVWTATVGRKSYSHRSRDKVLGWARAYQDLWSKKDLAGVP